MPRSWDATKCFQVHAIHEISKNAECREANWPPGRVSQTSLEDFAVFNGLLMVREEFGKKGGREW